MSPRERHFGRSEKAVISAAVTAAVGTISVFWARHHDNPRETVRDPKEFKPDVLNSDQLNPDRRSLLNNTMALLILAGGADRRDIMRLLQISKHRADDSIGYLTDYGLITRKLRSGLHKTNDEYVPVSQWKDELPLLLQGEPESDDVVPEQKYPYLAQSLEHLISNGILREAGVASDNS